MYVKVLLFDIVIYLLSCSTLLHVLHCIHRPTLFLEIYVELA